MGQNYLIDTNVLIEFIGNTLPENGHSFILDIIDSDFNISIVNKIEVLGHSSVNADIRNFMSLANVFQLNDDISEITINLRLQHKIKLPDAIVAATAINYGLILVTHNTKDSKNFEDLVVIDPYNV